MLKEEQPTLALLIRQEIAIKRLYEAFAVMFTEYEEFWTHVAEEEQSHANMLATLRDQRGIETWLIDEMQLSSEIIQKSIAYADDKRELALKGEVGLPQAFSIAENVEKYLMDGVFIKLEQKPMINVPEVMRTLAEETKKHQQLIFKKQNVLLHR